MLSNMHAYTVPSSEDQQAAHRNDLGVGVEELPMPSRVCGPQHLPHPALSESSALQLTEKALKRLQSSSTCYFKIEEHT